MRRCHYCDSAPGKTIDHIVPKALGGPNTRWNYIGACEKCNNEKADSWPSCPCGICALAVKMFLFAKERGLKRWPPDTFYSNRQHREHTDLLALTFHTFREDLWEERVERAERWDDAQWIDSGRINDERRNRRDKKRMTRRHTPPAVPQYLPAPGSPEYYEWYEGQNWDKNGFLLEPDEPAYADGARSSVETTDEEAV